MHDVHTHMNHFGSVMERVEEYKCKTENSMRLLYKRILAYTSQIIICV